MRDGVSLVIKRVNKNFWEISVDGKHVLRTDIRLDTYDEAFLYLKNYASSWLRMDFKVLRDDGTTWKQELRKH